MDFVCTLEWLGGSKGAVLSKAVLELHKVSCIIHSQKRDDNSGGKVFVHISASSRGKENINQVSERLTSLQDFKLIKAVAGTSLDLLDLSLDRDTALSKIATAYPNITNIVRQFSNTLSDNNLDSELHSLGKTVGGGVYKRDFSLGSPLALDKSLRRELTRALKAFSAASVEGNQITLKNCPFCAKDETENSLCAFVGGYIDGFLSKNPAIDIKQVTLNNHGTKHNNQSCSFDVIE